MIKSLVLLGITTFNSVGVAEHNIHAIWDNSDDTYHNTIETIDCETIVYIWDENIKYVQNNNKIYKYEINEDN